MPERHLPLLDEQLEEDPKAFLSHYKSCVQQASETLRSEFENGISAKQLVANRSAFVDEVLVRAWRQYFPESDETALIAVGGYGRGELHPASDVDILILTKKAPEGYRDAIEAFVMLLWDIGLEAGHSVRSVQQSVDEASADLSVITNLIESRLVTGSESLFSALQEAINPKTIWSSEQFFKAKLDEQDKRHEKFGDTAYNLEPNLKENPGGG